MIQRIIESAEAMKSLGEQVGRALRGHECLELIGDVGSGKTTFTKGLGIGLGLDEDVQSPSFTLSRVYPARDGLSLQHYDFYRLDQPGILSFELDESLSDPAAVTVVEWAKTVVDVLPQARIIVRITYQPDSEGREVSLEIPHAFQYLAEAFA